MPSALLILRPLNVLQVVSLGVAARRTWEGSGYAKRLTMLLLARVEDEELGVRKECARLFAVSEPEEVLPTLCSMLYHPEAKPRCPPGPSLTACSLYLLPHAIHPSRESCPPPPLGKRTSAPAASQRSSPSTELGHRS